MMSSASVNCAPNAFCRRPRFIFKISSGSSVRQNAAAPSACQKLSRKNITPANANSAPTAI